MEERDLDRKKQAMGRVLRYLTFRARSEQEIRSYLKKKEYSAETIEAVVENLKSYHYIDDRRFAEDFVEYKIRQGYGRLRIRYELLQKDLKKDLIEETLNDKIDEESEINLIKTLVAKRKPSDGNIDQKWLVRQVGYLRRRGFTDRHILNIMKDYQLLD